MAHSKIEDLPLSVHHVPNSIASLLIRVVGTLFLVNTAFVVFLLVALFVPSDYYTASITTLWILFTVQFIVSAMLLWRIITPWGSVQYYIQDNKLIFYHGFMGRAEHFYDLNSLRTVILRQSVLGKWLNYGNLELTVAASGYREDVTLHGIYNPKKYERALREHLAPLATP